MLSESESGDGSVRLPLLAFVVGHTIVHHNGPLFGSLGTIGETRLADWIDLATPLAVLVPLAVVLARVQPPAQWWWLFGIGAIVYVEGHGIHLSANSISNVDPGPATELVHLWDEVIGHYIWYGGFVVVAIAMIGALRAAELRLGWVGLLAGLVVGSTWATNGLEGGTALFSLVLALAALVYGWRFQQGIGQAVLASGMSAVVILLGYGLIHGGFPQPSSLAP